MSKYTFNLKLLLGDRLLNIVAHDQDFVVFGNLRQIADLTDTLSAHLDLCEVVAFFDNVKVEVSDDLWGVLHSAKVYGAVFFQIYPNVRPLLVDYLTAPLGLRLARL